LQNDYNCQKALFDKYSGVLLTICRRYFNDSSLAEDALQDGFIRIFNKIDQFKFEGSFEGWMKRITVNICLRKLQNENRKFDWSEIHHVKENAVNPVVDSDLNEEEILRLISKLPNGYRTVFNMYALDGFSHKEIAAKLGITDSTSRSQLVKARNMLQKMILDLYEE